MTKENNGIPSTLVARKNTSLRLKKDTLKTLKIIAIEEDTSVQKIIESLINQYLETRSKEQESYVQK